MIFYTVHLLFPHNVSCFRFSARPEGSGHLMPLLPTKSLTDIPLPIYVVWSYHTDVYDAIKADSQHNPNNNYVQTFIMLESLSLLFFGSFWQRFNFYSVVGKIINQSSIMISLLISVLIWRHVWLAKWPGAVFYIKYHTIYLPDQQGWSNRAFVTHSIYHPFFHCF